MAHAKPAFTRSSGNVFEDLRVDEPTKALAKSELAALIAGALRARRLTQTAADKPKLPECSFSVLPAPSYPPSEAPKGTRVKGPRLRPHIFLRSGS
jgi:hypothetical protein